MSRIRGKDTTPELAVRSALHRAGFRFRLHVRRLPGCPDVVLPRLKIAIFVHGCFWHQHPGCYHSGVPLSNVAYWKPKLERNVARHASNVRELTGQGWRVHTLWECEVAIKAADLIQLLSTHRRRQ